MILYLSGPITGVDNYMENFRQAREQLEAKGYSVINPAEIISVLHKDASYEQFMDVDLFLLDKCIALVQLPGWETSRGANRELGYALGREMVVLSLETLLKADKEVLEQ